MSIFQYDVYFNCNYLGRIVQCMRSQSSYQCSQWDSPCEQIDLLLLCEHWLCHPKANLKKEKTIIRIGEQRMFRSKLSLQYFPQITIENIILALTTLPDTTISSSVKMATHDTVFSCPYRVFSGHGVSVFVVSVWLWPAPWPGPGVAVADCGFALLLLFNDQTMQVQSFDPVTMYEPQLSNATQVITSKCRMIDATVLPRFTLITFNELSQIPAA